MLTCQLPAAHEIYSRVFNSPHKIKRFANEVLYCKVQHAHKILRGAVRSDLARLCDTITLAASFQIEPYEKEDANLFRAGLLADYPREHHFMLTEEHSSCGYASREERMNDGLEIFHQAADAIDALMSGASMPDAISALIMLRDKCEMAVNRLNASPAGQT
ncbi:MAG: hypothetical protein WCB68_17940 [Pyrinomonadaceae bacterium]